MFIKWGLSPSEVSSFPGWVKKTAAESRIGAFALILRQTSVKVKSALNHCSYGKILPLIREFRLFFVHVEIVIAIVIR